MFGPLSAHTYISAPTIDATAPSSVALASRMLKKYKAFMNNEGKFEQPGARALQDFINVYDQQLESERVVQAVKAAEKRVREAEEQAREAEQRAVIAERGSVETVTRERLFPETLSSGIVTPPDMPGPSPGMPVCAICLAYCHICPNPWQRTRSDLMVSKVTDVHRPKPVPYGIALIPCNHVFCGACLAQTIYHSLDMAFDPATYGDKLPSYTLNEPGLGRPEFPVFCPTCRSKTTQISDTTARLVLGEKNMNEWAHARFLSTLNLIYCPHPGCNEVFDADDAVPESPAYSRNRVQCPHCKRSLCKACKAVWHEDLTCLMYQASPGPSPLYSPTGDIRKHTWDIPANRRHGMYGPLDSPLTPPSPRFWEEHNGGLPHV
ncbi:hypothetical protein C8R43DRAFT_572418 [Mycena crocata]|nr:hypothetical protein C8R43DRAFT_572418 [Mycena crocata]